MIHAIKLSMWWLPQTSDTHIQELRWFKLMYTMQGKTGPTRHTHPTLSLHMIPDHTYLTRSTHHNLSRSHQQISTDPLPLRRRAPDTIHSSTIVWSAGPYPASLTQQPMRRWGKTSFQWQPTTRLTGPISPTHRSLTNIDGGYNLEDASFPHITPRPSQPMVSPFHLWAPPDLQFIQESNIGSKI
jgi:hypothetical protein